MSAKFMFTGELKFFREGDPDCFVTLQATAIPVVHLPAISAQASMLVNEEKRIQSNEDQP